MMDIQTIQNFRRSLRSIEREVEQQIKTDTVCCGVSLAQCHALMELGLGGAMTIVELAEVIKLDKSTLSRTIDSLVQLDLVDRTIDPADRRYMRIKLTDQGHKVFADINNGCNQLYLKVFDFIPNAKHKQVIESLGLFARALEKVQKDESAVGNCFCATAGGKEKL
jgi:DNA-binding MarR family transcriptional regulator